MDCIETQYEKRLAVERALQVCIQVVIDIANCILASLKENDVETHADLVEILRKKKIISPECTANVKKMIGLRNIIVHEYLGVDAGVLQGVVNNRLGDFAVYEREIRAYLDR